MHTGRESRKGLFPAAPGMDAASKPALLPGRMQPGSLRQPQPLAQCSSTASFFPLLLLLQETAKAEGDVGLMGGEGDSKV